MSEKQEAEKGKLESSPITDTSESTENKNAVSPSFIEALVSKLGKLTTKEKAEGMTWNLLLWFEP